MATAFDRLRGRASGRIEPQTITADGAFVFVLGAEACTVAAELAAGDYAAASQDVDLTSIDLVGANLRSLGVPIASFVYPVGFEVAADTLALWSLREDYVNASNLVQPGPALLAQAALSVGAEIYSFDGSACRIVPPTVLGGFLLGTNDPVLYGPGALTAYTLDAWLRFDADDHADSDGISPSIVALTEAGAGLAFSLAGEGGPGPQHRWWPQITHVNGGTTSAVIFGGYPITTTTGWHLLTVVYDATLVGVARCKLYVDGIYACDGASIMTVSPAAATAAGAITVASPSLWGGISQVRLCDTAHNAGAVLADYDACVDEAVQHEAAWYMEVRVDGDVYCRRKVEANEDRAWTDFMAPVRHLSGVHTVEVRLALEEEI
jgi:hypothetical protein